jgi:hypothetical protein
MEGLGNRRPATGVVWRMKLKVRVVHYRCQGCDFWYADIDDAEDRQPDDPFWYADGCRSHAEAIALACTQLAAIDHAIAAGAQPTRISEPPQSTRISEPPQSTRISEPAQPTRNSQPTEIARIGRSAADPAGEQGVGVGAEKAVA